MEKPLPKAVTTTPGEITQPFFIGNVKITITGYGNTLSFIGQDTLKLEKGTFESILIQNMGMDESFCVYCQRVIDFTCNGGRCTQPDRFIKRAPISAL